MMRSLFCLANASIAGGNKVLLEYARRLRQKGQDADVYVWHQNQGLEWFGDDLQAIEAADMKTALKQNYDLVFFARAFLVPLALPYLGDARPVYVCQDIEGAYTGTTCQSLSLTNAAFDEVMRLPMEIITTSKPVQQILFQRLGRNSHFVPLAVEGNFFKAREKHTREKQRKRILMVGDHLSPTKGIRDGIEALTICSADLPVQLVLITRQERGQEIFASLGYPCEIHVQPENEEIPEIYASCDLFCCPSWYEGFGLAALEAFSVGLPVVSTRNSGVSNYGSDEVNLLLCQPGDPHDLSAKLKRVLLDEELANTLVENGLKTATQFNWQLTMDCFIETQTKICAQPPEIKTVSSLELDKLLDRLEEQGLYTPQVVQEKCRYLFENMDSLLNEISGGGKVVSEGIKELVVLRDQLKNYLNNDRCQYYRSCKKRYDLCQLVIGLADDRNFQAHLGALLNQQAGRAIRQSIKI